jgi:hypothetical protein
MHHLKLLHGLLDQFITMGQDERSSTPLLQQQGEHDGFPRAGGKRDQHAMLPPGIRRQGRGNRLALIRPWGNHATSL